MMFGHVETIAERFEHLVRIREVQAANPRMPKDSCFYSMDFSGCRYFTREDPRCS
jgi:2-iminoacetate synthase ThiH